MALQHLRSSTAHKRPIPTVMSAGQIAVNTNEASPGLFFKDSNGDLVKVGPVHIGPDAPNSSPASVAATALVTGTVYQILTVGTSDFTSVGASANTVGTIFTATGTTTGTGTVSGQQGVEKGEQWLDNSGGTYVLKIYDGTAWRSESGTFVDVSGDTMTGDLVMNNANIVFEGATADDFETTLTVTDPTADRTITLPNVTGTVVTTGDTGTVTSTMISDGTIVNADVNGSAAIAGTKIDPDFGSQTVETTGVFSAAGGAAATPSIAFTGDLDTGIYSPGANQVAVATNGTGRLFVDANGNIGINTSSPSTAVTQFGGSAKGLAVSGSQPVVALADTSASTYAYFGLSDNDLYIDNLGTGFTRFYTNGSERVRIDSSGNVRIGQTSGSSTKLSVYGSQVRFQGASTGTGESDGFGIGNNGSTNPFIWNYENGFIQFGTNNTERMRIDSSGRLLVGSDSNGAAEKFTVHNGSDAANIVAITGADQTSEYLGLGIESGIPTISAGGAGSTSASLKFRTANNGAENERMRIDSSGNVGIGTTSPALKLHAEDSSSQIIRWARTGVGAGSLDVDASGNAVLNAHTTSTGIAFHLQASEKARLDSSGRLLVGTTTSTNVGSSVPAIQQIRYSSSNVGLSITRDGNASNIVLARTSSAPYGLVSINNTLGQIRWAAGDGTDIETNAAEISCQVDGTPGTNDMPGRLVFSTTADGASSPTERWRIDNAGSLVGVAGSAFVAPYIYNTTTATAANVNVDASGFLRRSTSSIKYKTNVETIQDQYADAILGCRPVWYQSTCEADKPESGHWGFIAEEVAAIDPRLCFFKEEEDGTLEPEGVQYDRFVPHLLNLIKRQKDQIEAMEARLSALEAH